MRDEQTTKEERMKDIEKMSVSELRAEVRRRGLAKGVIVVTAKRLDLLALLNGEISSLEERRPFVSPHTHESVSPPTRDDIYRDPTNDPDLPLSPAPTLPVVPALPSDEEPTVPMASSTPNAEKVLTDLATLVAGKGIDESRVNAIVDERLQDTLKTDQLADVVQPIIDKAFEDVQRPVIHNITLASEKVVTIEEHTHECFEEALRLLAAGMPLFLVGPSGTGKTFLSKQLAKALDVTFSFNSMSAGCSESHVIGRTLPDSEGNWTYKPAPFVRSFGEGGLHLFDELDGADPNLLILINAPLSNHVLSIPFEDKFIEEHADFRVVAAANTYGNGASREYCGRNALDAATLDRFATSTIEVDYDTSLERTLVSEYVGPEKGKAIIDKLTHVRNVINSTGLRRIMSTRTMVNAAKLVAAGDTMENIMKRYLSSWTADEKGRVA